MFDPATLTVLNALRSQLSREGKPERDAIKLLCSTDPKDQAEANRLLAARKAA
jgi:hypothetical protein